MNLQPSYLNLVAQAIIDDLAGGKIRFYTDPMPAHPADAITTQVKLAELGFSNPAGAVVDGVITFGPVTPDNAADATGTATWARLLKSDGTTAVLDTTVGPDGDLVGTSAITSGQTVAIDTLVLIADGE